MKVAIKRCEIKNWVPGTLCAGQSYLDEPCQAGCLQIWTGVHRPERWQAQKVQGKTRWLVFPLSPLQPQLPSTNCGCQPSEDAHNLDTLSCSFVLLSSYFFFTLLIVPIFAFEGEILYYIIIISWIQDQVLISPKGQMRVVPWLSLKYLLNR